MTEIQEIILEIFIEIKKICERHNIDYYAIGGTCIGAVRHNGFIPWDDDLDIAIPIERYFEFLEIAKKELPNYFSVYTCDKVVHHTMIISKIIDERTTFIEKTNLMFPDAHKGVWVDIMPISGVPADEKKRKLFFEKIKKYNKYNLLLRFPCRFFKGMRARFLWTAVCFLKLVLPYNYFSNKWINLLRENPFDKAEYVGYVWWPSDIKRLVFEKKAFGSSVNLPFEKTEISCPVGWDEYLSVQFGDYMKLPPESERISTHVTEIIDIHKSYKEYK
jgi:lipopolysaccharide cholinephosphotransferase